MDQFFVNSHISSAGFELPHSAPQRIRDFNALWHDLAEGDLPQSTDFDVVELSTDYPLLVRIRLEGPKNTLVLDDIAVTDHWPFQTPVKGKLLADFIPEHSKKRVLGAFEEALENGIPTYYETTSWLHGGQIVSLARLVVPLAAGEGRELIALWDVMEPVAAA